MVGKYEIEVYNKRVHYHLTIQRNITILQGNSATGKTELLRMLSDYANNGASSGITVISEKRCVVLENMFWKENISSLTQSIIFIDEGASFLRSKEFAEAVKGSDNYFVLITRDSLEQLPYSIQEIYGMRQDREQQKYKTPKRIYNEIYPLYGTLSHPAIKPTLVLTEDSNSGYEFFSSIYGTICHSANGKSNILSEMQKSDSDELLAIVDGAAFGAEMAGVMRYIADSQKKITLYTPESFEYLLLKAGIFSNLPDITDETWKYADSCQYFSWEEFFTAYLIQISQGTIYQYNKKKLPAPYLTAGSRKKILSQMPEQIQNFIQR